MKNSDRHAYICKNANVVRAVPLHIKHPRLLPTHRKCAHPGLLCSNQSRVHRRWIGCGMFYFPHRPYICWLRRCQWLYLLQCRTVALVSVLPWLLGTNTIIKSIIAVNKPDSHTYTCTDVNVDRAVPLRIKSEHTHISSQHTKEKCVLTRASYALTRAESTVGDLVVVCSIFIFVHASADIAIADDFVHYKIVVRNAKIAFAMPDQCATLVLY